MLSALILLAAAPFAFATAQQPASALPPQAASAGHADSAQADSTKRKKKGISIAIQIGGDSARAHMQRDSTNRRNRGDRRPPKRIPVTPELMATAFADEQARAIVLRARAAQ